LQFLRIITIGVLTVGSFIIATQAIADIYTYIDERGVIHFSNTPTSPRYRLKLREFHFDYKRLSSGAYDKAMRRLSSKITLFGQSCPLFVPLVEEGWIGEKVTGEVADIYLMPLKKKRIDTLILGCTHYPILKEIIGKVMGKGVVLVDSAREVARAAKEILDANGLLSAFGKASKSKFFVSDEPEHFIKLGERILKRKMGSVKKAPQV